VIGTDGGGSIRIPASFTGTFGLKPSFGRVPAFPISPFGTVAHLGPMARTVEDAAMFLSVIAEGDARDWYAQAPDGQDYVTGLDAGIKGARIAYSPRMGIVSKIHGEVEALVAQAVQKFADLGATVEEVDPPGGDPTEAFQTLWWSGAYFALGDLPEEKKALLDPGLRDVVQAGAKYSLRDYLSAVHARETYGSQMRQFMEDYDFLLTPAVAVPAFDVGCVAPEGYDARQWLDWTPFSYPFNLTQQPAASINCGFTKDGLPVGLQIVGCMYDDASVLHAAYAFEKIEPAATRHAAL
jgi:aspartyl-tRNA(Asn)/glutamyl-tRNA(Gln) amidotransferase subunit A